MFSICLFLLQKELKDRGDSRTVMRIVYAVGYVGIIGRGVLFLWLGVTFIRLVSVYTFYVCIWLSVCALICLLVPMLLAPVRVLICVLVAYYVCLCVCVCVCVLCVCLCPLDCTRLLTSLPFLGFHSKPSRKGCRWRYW